ncbi:MAG TPA: prepilin peptidase [Terriglobia bacterium]|nr:prepilin peptidase [Terriglobia bacterium]
MPIEISLLLPDFFFILLGLIIGSFLNVCIARLPVDESVVLPNSRCPKCGKAIKPYDNIPVLSYLLLRGRCRYCRDSISWQYPVVELLTASVFFFNFHGLNFLDPTLFKAHLPERMALSVFFSALLVLCFIDLNERILPDVITKPGIVLGLLFSAVNPVDSQSADNGRLQYLVKYLVWLGVDAQESVLLSVFDSVIGALACAGFLRFVAWGYLRFRGIEGMGLGDVKLMAMIGAWLGLFLGFITIMLGSLLGSVVGLVLMGVGWMLRLLWKTVRGDSGVLPEWATKGMMYELPFGTFLAVVAILMGLWGVDVVRWYDDLGRPTVSISGR